ncbi:MAG: hypothetical protein LW707_00635 [Sphingobacteriales bacterium]|nr:hypothetical protein [Sphingobacteriales bacterium]
MEFKTLVYIIVGLAWLLSKLLHKQQSPIKSPIPSSDMRPVDVPAPTAVSRSLKRPAPRPTLIKTTQKKSGSFIRPNQELPDAYAYELAESKPLDAGIISDPVENNSVAGTVEPSRAALIGEEVSNGTIDLKKAFLINELMSRKYN